MNNVSVSRELLERLKNLAAVRHPGSDVVLAAEKALAQPSEQPAKAEQPGDVGRQITDDRIEEIAWEVYNKERFPDTDQVWCNKHWLTLFARAVEKEYAALAQPSQPAEQQAGEVGRDVVGEIIEVVDSAYLNLKRLWFNNKPDRDAKLSDFASLRPPIARILNRAALRPAPQSEPAQEAVAYVRLKNGKIDFDENCLFLDREAAELDVREYANAWDNYSVGELFFAPPANDEAVRLDADRLIAALVLEHQAGIVPRDWFVLGAAESYLREKYGALWYCRDELREKPSFLSQREQVK